MYHIVLSGQEGLYSVTWRGGKNMSKRFWVTEAKKCVRRFFFHACMSTKQTKSSFFFVGHKFLGLYKRCSKHCIVANCFIRIRKNAYSHTNTCYPPNISILHVISTHSAQFISQNCSPGFPTVMPVVWALRQSNCVNLSLGTNYENSKAKSAKRIYHHLTANNFLI